jgi:hypothetical protein
MRMSKHECVYEHTLVLTHTPSVGALFHSHPLLCVYERHVYTSANIRMSATPPAPCALKLPPCACLRPSTLASARLRLPPPVYTRSHGLTLVHTRAYSYA